MRVILAFEDAELTAYEKQKLMLDNLYPVIPGDLQGAVEKANWFLNCGDVSRKASDGVRLYSFEKDANFIFAAFRQTHGIDLQNENLHWWKFIALFMDLGQDTTFCQLTALRKRVKSGKATKEERQAARNMGDMFTIEDDKNYTREEKAIIDRVTENYKKARARLKEK